MVVCRVSWVKSRASWVKSCVKSCVKSWVKNFDFSCFFIFTIRRFKSIYYVIINQRSDVGNAWRI